MYNYILFEETWGAICVDIVSFWWKIAYSHEDFSVSSQTCLGQCFGSIPVSVSVSVRTISLDLIEVSINCKNVDPVYLLTVVYHFSLLILANHFCRLLNSTLSHTESTDTYISCANHCSLLIVTVLWPFTWFASKLTNLDNSSWLIWKRVDHTDRYSRL